MASIDVTVGNVAVYVYRQTVSHSHAASSDTFKNTTIVASSQSALGSLVRSSTLHLISVGDVDSKKQSVLPTPPL